MDAGAHAASDGAGNEADDNDGNDEDDDEEEEEDEGDVFEEAWPFVQGMLQSLGALPLSRCVFDCSRVFVLSLLLCIYRQLC